MNNKYSHHDISTAIAILREVGQLASELQRKELEALVAPDARKRALREAVKVCMNKAVRHDDAGEWRDANTTEDCANEIKELL